MQYLLGREIGVEGRVVVVPAIVARKASRLFTDEHKSTEKEDSVREIEQVSHTIPFRVRLLEAYTNPPTVKINEYSDTHDAGSGKGTRPRATWYT
jgi:hypothetical protein